MKSVSVTIMGPNCSTSLCPSRSPIKSRNGDKPAKIHTPHEAQLFVYLQILPYLRGSLSTFEVGRVVKGADHKALTAYVIQRNILALLAFLYHSHVLELSND
jgi:hypothetical protein